LPAGEPVLAGHPFPKPLGRPHHSFSGPRARARDLDAIQPVMNQNATALAIAPLTLMPVEPTLPDVHHDGERRLLRHVRRLLRVTAAHL